jgi:hypothetical protein
LGYWTAAFQPVKSRTEQSDGAERPTLERTLALVSTTAALARLGVSRGSLARLARIGQLPALRPGTDRSYVPADLALPERTCAACGTSLADRPPNARFCLACYRTRKSAAVATSDARRRRGRERP